MADKPSRHFCETGSLARGEKFNREIHNSGTTPKERCEAYYPEYGYSEESKGTSGGRRRKSRKNRRKTRKSRKNRRKTNRRR